MLPPAVIKNILGRIDDGLTFGEAVMAEDALFDPMTEGEAAQAVRLCSEVSPGLGRFLPRALT